MKEEEAAEAAAEREIVVIRSVVFPSTFAISVARARFGITTHNNDGQKESQGEGKSQKHECGIVDKPVRIPA